MTDPTLGIWISEDGEVGTPDPRNLYRFEGDNPTNEVDPSGLGGSSYLTWLALQRMRFYKTPEPGSRLNYSGRTAMSVLHIEKYAGIFSFEITPEYNKFAKGCIGLLYIRLNSPDNGAPWSLRGTKAFNNLDSALAEQRQRAKGLKEDEVAVLYAIQTTNEKLIKDAIKPGSNEYDLSKLKLSELGSYNFASAAQTKDGTIRFWEWMSGGAGAGENPELIVRHGAELPKDDGHGNPYREENTIYVVVTIKKHQRAMPVVE